MQNRYTGDIGDFGKLGLLRRLHAANLSIGVNWYLSPDESHNGNGRHVDYLYDERFRACDEPLWLELRSIIESQKRAVFQLQDKSILDAVFYSDPLDFRRQARPERAAIRKAWHENALIALSGVDIVFVDPDNGLIVPSAEGTPKENKYVLPNELADYFQQGSSVVYYQHKARKQDDFYTDQHIQLIRSSGFEGSSGLALKFKTISQRYYFFIMHQKHKPAIEGAVQSMLTSEWRRHFCELSL